MRLKSPLSLLLLAPAALAPALAQEKLEVGGLALMAAYRSADVKSGPSIGSVGFAPGPAGGAFVGQTMNNHLGGELRYMFAQNDLELSSGGRDIKFSGRSHIFGYDLMVYPTGRNASIRPFLAGGGGMKIYQGTGTEQAFQPLANLALLTRTREVMPMADFGGGVKIRTSRNTMVRVEFRDYITQVPKVFAASPGSKISGLLHHWAPAFGFSWTF